MNYTQTAFTGRTGARPITALTRELTRRMKVVDESAVQISKQDARRVVKALKGAIAVSNGAIENTYRLQVTNSQESTRRFALEVQGLEGLRIDSDSALTVGPAASASMPVRLVLPGALAAEHAGQSLRVTLVVSPDGARRASAASVRADAVFIVPR